MLLETEKHKWRYPGKVKIKKHSLPNAPKEEEMRNKPAFPKLHYMGTAKWTSAWQDQQNGIMHPAKTQISLGIHPVWSESSLCAQ